MEQIKYSVFLLWFGSAGAMLFGDGTVAVAGKVTFWVTLVAHFAEWVWKRPVLARAGGDPAHHFIQTMIYGLFHWKPIEDRLGSR
jgi:hypothetical protein